MRAAAKRPAAGAELAAAPVQERCPVKCDQGRRNEACIAS